MYTISRLFRSHMNFSLKLWMLTSSNMRCGAQQQPQRQRQRQWQENCNERKENDEKNWTLLTIQWIQFNSIQLHINWLKIEFQLNNSWWIYCANAEQLLRIINKTIFSINQIEQKKNFLDFTFDCAETPCDVICNKITELTKKWNRKMKWSWPKRQTWVICFCVI